MIPISVAAATAFLVTLLPLSPRTALAFRPVPSRTAAAMSALHAHAPSRVPTEELLSRLVHATFHGARTVASLSSARQKAVLKEADDARSAMTEADTAAQRVVVSSLRAAYPTLRIVGEEDDSVEADAAAGEALRDDLLAGHAWAAPASGDPGAALPAALDLKEVTVFVDPLDGTREFVEGRLENVQTLVGLCYQGRPVMGAVGLPFPAEDGIEVVFGMAGRGLGRMRANGLANMVPHPLPNLTRYQEGNPLVVTSGDSSKVVALVDLAERTFMSEGISRRLLGATGNKLLQVIYGHCTLALLHDGTSLWDTAAPTALLEAAGGRLTDYFGEPLVYDAAGSSLRLGNRYGVVASAPGAAKAHLRLVAALRGDRTALALLAGDGAERDGETEAQCADVARDLDGYPLTAAHLARATGRNAVASYSCPEAAAVRGMMSNACRVRLAPGGGTAFYKRVDFARLAHMRANLKSAPHKLARDVKSYRVEVSRCRARGDLRAGSIIAHAPPLLAR